MKNLTGDSSKAYLADSLTEVLISNLARVRALRVPSFAGVAGFRGKDEPSASVAKQLNAQLLLAGSIVGVGSQMRIAVHLIDPASDTVIWAEELTREASQLLSAQTEIARLVAAHLRLRLSADEERALAQRKIEPQAQDAYLRGLAQSQTALDLPSATATVEHFRRAVTIDPNFAAAWGELAIAEIKRINRTFSLDRAAAAGIPREQAQRAIQLDPTLAAGYAALGTVQFYFDWDFAAAERTVSNSAHAGSERHSSADTPTAMLLAALGGTRMKRSRSRVKRSRLEPLVPGATIHLGTAYYYARQYDAARDGDQASSRVLAGQHCRSLPARPHLLGSRAPRRRGRRHAARRSPSSVRPLSRRACASLDGRGPRLRSQAACWTNCRSSKPRAKATAWTISRILRRRAVAGRGVLRFSTKRSIDGWSTRSGSPSILASTFSVPIRALTSFCREWVSSSNVRPPGCSARHAAAEIGSATPRVDLERKHGEEGEESQEGKQAKTSAPSRGRRVW